MREGKNIACTLLFGLALLLAHPLSALAVSTGTVSVSMVSSEDPSQAVPGAVVTLEGTADDGSYISQTTTADTTGQASFSGLPAGTYTVTQISTSDGFTMPNTASASVVVGQSVQNYYGTVTFQNTGYEEEIPAADETQESTLTYVDQASWFVSSFVDEQGTSLSGLTASQGATLTSFEGSSSAPQSTQTGEQTVSLSWNGLSSSVSDTIPSGTSYQSTQSFSLTQVSVGSASVTLVNDPIHQETEVPSDQSTLQEETQDNTASSLSPSESLKTHELPQQEETPALDTTEELVDTPQKDELENSEPLTNTEAQEPPSETPEFIVPEPSEIIENIDHDQGTVPALERLIPDPALRALLAFVGLFVFGIALLLGSHFLDKSLRKKKGRHFS